MWTVALVSITHQEKFKQEARPFCTRIYVPMIKDKKKVRHKSAPVEVLKPAFGRYVFLRIKKDGLRGVLDCEGCHGLVMRGEEIAYLKPKAIKQIKALERLNFGLNASPVLDQRTFNPGDRVAILLDAFEGQVGKIVKATSRGQYEIALGNVALFVPIDRLARI